MSLAVFLLPEGPLKTELVRWKERIKKEYPGQTYTSHPPHMTLINMDSKNEKDGVTLVSALSGFIKSVQISINRTDVFWNDTATGGHTLFFGIEKNDALNALQKLLAEVLKEVKKNVPPPNYLTGNEQLIESYNRYGSPFIGDHWIPHFSVSSLRTEKTHPIIEDFLSNTKQYHFTAHQISLWRVHGNEHTQLAKVELQ